MAKTDYLIITLANVMILFSGLHMQQQQLVYSQPPVDVESGIVVDEIDLPVYDSPPNADVSGDEAFEVKATGSEIVEVGDTILEDVL
jgi:hypothetical protein